ncbi:MAG TPA: pentapeptide repeat-containing protein [Holophaga sp.]|nr:pentapeptide repeat-containing protein [Holophaga sp.]
MEQLVPETTYEFQELVEVDFSDQAAEAVCLRNCRLSKVKFTRSRLQRLDLDKVEADDCDFANAFLPKARLDRVVVKESRLVGIDLSGALVKASAFEACDATYGNFRSAVFRKCRFRACNLRGADFQGADLRSAVFEQCDLREAQLSFAKLDGADLRGSELTGLRVGIENLRGAIVDPAQAAYLAGLMGLKVVW